MKDTKQKEKTYTCKFCGMDELVWVDCDGKFRLFDTRTGAMHICIKYEKGDGSDKKVL